MDDRSGAAIADERSRSRRQVPRVYSRIRGATFVREDYLASYEGDRLTRSAALVRAYPKDLAALAPRLGSIEVPVRSSSVGTTRTGSLVTR